MNTCHFSTDRQYRYTLEHRWSGGRMLVVVGLNPSTADEQVLDPTLRLIKKFAQRWGFGGFCMLNLFAFRATKPKDMRAAADPVGPANDRWIRRKLSEYPGPPLVCWGNGGSYMDRDLRVLTLIELAGRWAECFKVTGKGQPHHPLYLPDNARKRPYLRS